jgi:hypothetical protein
MTLGRFRQRLGRFKLEIFRKPNAHRTRIAFSPRPVIREAQKQVVYDCGFAVPLIQEEQQKEMMMPESPPAVAVEYQDRKTGLVVFGVLMVAMGCLVALFVPLMLWAQVASAKTTHVAATPQTMMPAAIFSSLFAIGLVWLGIGSILARRWARALILILSWTWLVIGILSMIYLVFLMPQIMEALDTATPPGRAGIPKNLKTTILIVQGIFSFFLYVVLPGVWVLFYKSKNVKTTCEVRDPVPRWTDRCPLPVLAISVWAGFGAVSMLLVAFMYRGIMPFFGMFLTGIWGTAGWILLAILWGYAARAIYKLEISGWWIVLLGMCLASISGFLTYSRHDIGELYRLIGYPEEQIALVEKFNFFKNRTLAWSTLAFSVPFVGYLLYIRKYFTRPAALASR